MSSEDATNVALVPRMAPDAARDTHSAAVQQKRLRRKAAAAPLVDPAVWRACYPASSSVPLDQDGYAASFSPPQRLDGADCSPDASAFFAEHGYVVFSDVLTPAECTATVDELWRVLEAETPGVTRDATESWGMLSAQTYGLVGKDVLFTPQVVRNRQNPRLVACFAALLGADARPEAPQRDGLVVSTDRCCLFRPTQAGRTVGVDHPEWRTRENLHLDLHPWAFRDPEAVSRQAVEAMTYASPRDFSKENNWVNAETGPHIQAVLALANNAAEDGGTVIVPNFARAFDAWVDALGPVDLHTDAAASAARAAGDDTRPWLISRDQGGGSFKFAPRDPLCALARRVPLRAGHLLVWDQRTAHGTHGNASDVPRYAQFIKAWRVTHASEERLQRRAAAMLRHLRAAGVEQDITELGKRVFGLHWAPL